MTKNHKDRLLEHLLGSESIYKSIIFSATKHYADKLASRLRDQGFAAFPLHGDMNQSKRNRAIEQFRHGKTQILVATDLAARGIDISDLSHVINYDIPRAARRLCAPHWTHWPGWKKRDCYFLCIGQ